MTKQFSHDLISGRTENIGEKMWQIDSKRQSCRFLAVLGIFLFIALLYPLPFAYAEEAGSTADLDSFLKNVETKAASVSALTCAFSQERHLSIFTKPVTFKGQLSIVRPYRLRWEVTSPLRSVIIFDENKGIRCSGDSAPQKFDLSSDPVMRMVSQQMRTWMDAAYADLRASYQIKFIAGPGITLLPTDPKIAKVIAEITITFDPLLLHPVRVKILEPGNDFTVISFHDYVLNTLPPETLFTRCYEQ